MRSISPELWKRIEPILEKALELEGEAQALHLEQACGDDEELRSQVEALLAADVDAGNLLSRPVHENDLTPAGGLAEPGRGGLGADSSTSVSAEGRYAPGALVSGRFRILTWLGRGGMGEVYRADDLKLGRPVALKFLPEEAERDPDRLERFFNEVRTALQVSHPNVTRIHDIGEADGQHFISMEYVDGEDLASLLRRIGRLPRDKAVEVARQLCAGLAAAHDRGVLHRDLKPANVMIDGRGQVKITDFGLAAFDDTVRGAEAFAGTPAYMAPEQWAGGEVTRQSDLYALGLLLYELFTGQGAFAGRSPEEIGKAHRAGTSTAPDPTTIVEGLDPSVERVILRCLEPEPARRPSSALAVAATLPGGDPLAAALAAGETPSPEMVAQAAAKTGLAPRHAWPVFAAFLLLLGYTITQAGRFQLARLAPLTNPPEVLAHQADEILASLGFTEPTGDRLSFFHPDFSYLRHIGRTDRSPDRWLRLRRSRPAAYRYWLRQSPSELVRRDPSRLDNRLADPPLTEPGMVELALDAEGRLLELTAVPARLQPAEDTAPEADWASLFAAAGLEMSSFTASDPTWAPPVFADRRRAWEGVFPEAPQLPLRVEAASARGQPVAFRLLGPWDLARQESTSTGVIDRPFGFLYSATLLAALAVGALAAVRNLRRQRGDLKTARRLALFVFALRVSYLLAAHHIRGRAEIDLLTAHLAQATLWAGGVWLFYLAVEPYARRIWPRMLTTWVRLFDGRLRDPLVSRDLLLGALVGLFNANTRIFNFTVATPRLGGSPSAPFWSSWSDVALDGFPATLAAIAALGPGRIRFMLGIVVLLTIFRLLTRRTWTALGIVSLVAILGSFPGGDDPGLFVAFFSLNLALSFVVLLRVGLLAYLTLHSIVLVVWNLPLTLDTSAWYFGSSLATIAFLVGLAGWGFYHSLVGRGVAGAPATAPSRAA